MTEIKVKYDVSAEGDAKTAFEIRDDGYAITMPAQPDAGLNISIKRTDKEGAPEFIQVRTANGQLLGMVGQNETVEYRAVRRRRGRLERLLDLVLRRMPREVAWDKTKPEGP